ncbi:PepSY domain-containing protein [Phocaeicola sp.]|uniref:PepSY-associated TM helix domain-containing protein n=1 Tax=Phocaeicola sp. TaxID=2773926 RepID=UPI0023CD7CAC|nr:PepSY-associated TM helix domain-containing protein [Phocaeicola sp.]MDE5677090.1 PepSY domain-containing protein [Phocaeicola sp.]
MKKLFRKIHLWLSVPFGLFITLICFSGTMLVFEKEITEMCRRDLYFVEEVKEQPLPLDELMRTVAATLPDSVTITGVTISPDTERAYQVSLSKPRRASIYVDQYTGRVKGRSERLPFYDTMFHLHRWMLGSSQGFGKLLVGTSTLLLVIILVTGLLMWLTNKHKPLAKSLTISFTKGWPRFWHDLHVAGGIYATIFLLLLALTGLTWSFSWYRTGFYSLFGVEATARQGSGGRAEGSSAERPKASETPAHAHESGDAGQPQAAAEEGERGSHRRGGASREEGVRGVASRGDAAREGFRHGRPEAAKDSAAVQPDSAMHHRRSGRSPRAPFAHWQEVYEHLAMEHPGYRQITLAEGSASVVPAGRNSLRSGDRFDFDVRSGKITGSKPYAGQDKATKMRSTVYTMHVGSWGGIFTRILTFLSALLGATLPLTGYYLWLKKLKNKSARKSGKK